MKTYKLTFADNHNTELQATAENIATAVKKACLQYRHLYKKNAPTIIDCQPAFKDTPKPQQL